MITLAIITIELLLILRLQILWDRATEERRNLQEALIFEIQYLYSDPRPWMPELTRKEAIDVLCRGPVECMKRLAELTEAKD